MSIPLVELGLCCEIVSGATPSTSVAENWNGDICWATPKDLSDLEGHYISDTPRKISARGLANCAASVLPAYSVLFSSRAPIGHVAVNTVSMATNQGFKSLVPDVERVDAKYLFHWLRANRSYLESLGNGATFKELSKSVFSRVKIPLPHLTEQRRIAAILDQADALRAKRRESLAQLDRLTQAIFIDMFGDETVNSHGWPVQALSSVVADDDNINYGVVQPGDDVPNGVPLVRVSDLREGKVAHDALKRIDEQIERAYSRSRLRGDEILLSCVGSVGVVALATEAERGFNIARAVARIRVSPRADRTFIAAQLQSKRVQRYFTQELRTVSQPTLNIKQIAETEIVCPPLELQREFAHRAKEARALEVRYQVSASEFELLFASLQHRAFRGEL